MLLAAKLALAPVLLLRQGRALRQTALQHQWQALAAPWAGRLADLAAGERARWATP